MRVTRLLTFIVLAVSILNGCESSHQRANRYVEKAQELFEQGDYVSAKIEALNAVQIEGGHADARYLLARIAEEDRNLLQSVYHLRIAAETDPEHVEARLFLGNLYFLAKFPELAAEEARRVLKLAPKNAEVRTLQARIYFQEKEFEAAEEEIDYALELDPKLIGAIIFKAGLLVNVDDYNGAIDYIDEKIKDIEFGDVLPLRQFRIMLLRGADRLEEVETELQALIREFPDRESFAVSLARLYASQEMIDKTEAIIQSLIDKYPNDMNRRVGYVQFIAENRGIDNAIEALEEIIVEFPDQLVLRLLLGRLHEAIDSTQIALSTYREIATTAPRSRQGLAARNRIVVYLIASGQTDRAMRMVREILADEVNNTEALLVNATYKFSNLEYESSIADLRIVLRSDDMNEHALLLLARAHTRVGNVELAEDAFRRLIRVNPYHPSAAAEWSRLLSSRGNTIYAAEILDERLTLEPTNREVAAALIEALLDLNDLDEAEKIAREMVATNDASGLAEFQFGQVMLARENWDAALEAFTESLSKDPKAEPAMIGISEVFTEQDQHQRAIQYLQSHLRKYPSLMYPKFLIGTIYQNAGDLSAAKTQYERVIADHPDATRAYIALVKLYPDDPEERIRIYQQGREENQDDQAIKLFLAVEYQDSGYIEDAIGLYEEIIRDNPSNDAVANNLAVLLLDYRSDAESHAKALELAKRFSRSPHAAVIDTLGWAYYRNGDNDNAILYLNMALQNAEEAASMHYHLGMVYYSEQKLLPAREELQKSILLAQTSYPGIDEARETLDSILNQSLPE